MLEDLGIQVIRSRIVQALVAQVKKGSKTLPNLANASVNA